jgi:predicted HicB family RNase H-like nuclease
MKSLTYKGYMAELVIDLEARVLHGRVLGLRDVITFQGDTIDEAEQAFHDSIDDYLAFCAARDEEPERPFSGKILFRTTSDQHRRIALAAQRAGLSVNAWMQEALDRVAGQDLAERAPSTATATSALIGSGKR